MIYNLRGLILNLAHAYILNAALDRETKTI
jgi:hypothetical protein